MTNKSKYSIFESLELFEGEYILQYGISYSFNGISEYISDITENKKFAEEILNLLLTNEVEKEHFKDIVEDCIIKKFTY